MCRAACALRVPGPVIGQPAMHAPWPYREPHAPEFTHMHDHHDNTTTIRTDDPTAYRRFDDYDDTRTTDDQPPETCSYVDDP